VCSTTLGLRSAGGLARSRSKYAPSISDICNGQHAACAAALLPCPCSCVALLLLLPSLRCCLYALYRCLHHVLCARQCVTNRAQSVRGRARAPRQTPHPAGCCMFVVAIDVRPRSGAVTNLRIYRGFYGSRAISLGKRIAMRYSCNRHPSHRSMLANVLRPSPVDRDGPHSGV
jgi:hypothetical protein